MIRNDLLEREPVTHRPLPPWHAVIFADGETDDVPGFEAALANEPVWVDERLYEPGETVVVCARRILLSRWPFPWPPANGFFPYAGGRSVELHNCQIFICNG